MYTLRHPSGTRHETIFPGCVFRTHLAGGRLADRMKKYFLQYLLFFFLLSMPPESKALKERTNPRQGRPVLHTFLLDYSRGWLIKDASDVELARRGLASKRSMVVSYPRNTNPCIGKARSIDAPNPRNRTGTPPALRRSIHTRINRHVGRVWLFNGPRRTRMGYKRK